MEHETSLHSQCGMSGEPCHSCGIYGVGETPQEPATRRLPTPPAGRAWVAAIGTSQPKLFKIANLKNGFIF